MAYRDDLEAVRLHKDQLEQQLEEAQEEIARLHGEKGEKTAALDRPPELPTKPSSSQGGSAGGIALGIVLVAVGLAAVVVLRAPTTIMGGLTLLTLGIAVVALSSVGYLLCIARPSEALVISGGQHRLPDGSISPLRILHGGRAIRKPLLELVHTMDLRVLRMDVQIRNAYCRDKVPLTIDATALVKVSADPLLTRNAAERFLDLGPADVARTAEQTLEGCLREAVAGLPLAQLDRERLRIARRLADAAKDDFAKLGLELVGCWLMRLRDDGKQLERHRREGVAETLRAVGLPAPDPEEA